MTPAWRRVARFCLYVLRLEFLLLMGVAVMLVTLFAFTAILSNLK